MITDLQGRVMLRVKLSAAGQQVDISSLVKGVYVVKVGDEQMTILKRE